MEVFLAMGVEFNVNRSSWRWTKQAGEEVEEGETIAEFDLDKATCTFHAPGSGIFYPVAIPEIIMNGQKVCEIR